MSFDFVFNSLFIVGFSLGGGLTVIIVFYLVFEIYDRYILGEKSYDREKE